MWGDLFLASGGVVNFNNGDVTLTHASDSLTIAGGDFNVGIIDGQTINLDGDGSPTADILQIGSGDTSATDGVDALQLTFTSDDASGNIIDITPTFTDNDAGNNAETWNVIDVDALTVTQNDSGGAVTGTVRGINIGTLTETATGDDAISSSAIAISSGWDANLLFVDTTTQIQISDSGTLTFENVTGTDFLTLSAGSIVATGAVSGVTTMSSSGDWTWTSTTPNITINDNETFTIVDAATVDTFTVNTSGSLFSYSDGTSSFTFDVDSGPLYAGSARPAKSIKLSPEYEGAILTASASASTVGTMTSDAVRDSTEGWENYYEWTSTQASLQDYTVVVKFTLPSDFSAWATSDAIKINFVTEVTTNTKNKLDLVLYNMTSSPDTPVAAAATQASGTNAVWTSLSLDDTLLDDGSSPDLDTAAQTGVLFLKVYSLLDAVNCTGGVNNGCYVRLGDIQLSYLAKY